VVTGNILSVCLCVCVWCVHACMRACVRACVCVCVYNAMQRIWATSKSKECYQQGMHTPGGQTLHHCGKHSVTSTCRDCRQLAALIRAIETKVLSCLIWAQRQRPRLIGSTARENKTKVLSSFIWYQQRKGKEPKLLAALLVANRIRARAVGSTARGKQNKGVI